MLVEKQVLAPLPMHGNQSNDPMRATFSGLLSSLLVVACVEVKRPLDIAVRLAAGALLPPLRQPHPSRPLHRSPTDMLPFAAPSIVRCRPSLHLSCAPSTPSSPLEGNLVAREATARVHGTMNT